MAVIDEIGIQLHLPSTPYSMPQLLELGRIAQEAGINELWVTDNLYYRNIFVVLAALAATVRIKLGTAVMVQYFHNPVDVADALATISEIAAGEELSVGIGRGNHVHTTHQVEIIKPLGIMQEFAVCINSLLAGEPVNFADYPLLASYFRLKTDSESRLTFRPACPVRLYCGGNGPKSIAIGGRVMDGLIFGPSFIYALLTGRVQQMLDLGAAAAAEARPGKVLRKVAELNISVSTDRRAAREFAKRTTASLLLSTRQSGYTGKDYAQLGIDERDMDRLYQASEVGVAGEELSSLVNDAMIDAVFVAGDVHDCRGRIIELCTKAKSLGFHQVMFSKFGPDYRGAMQLLTDEIMPVLQ